MRYRRRLRSRLIVSFVLLGFALTGTFAVATLYLRDRLENQLIVDFLMKEATAFAQFKQQNPSEDAQYQLSDEKVLLFAYREGSPMIPPEWKGLPDGVHSFEDRDGNGQRVAYKLAVSRSADVIGYLRYSYRQEALGQRQLAYSLIGAVLVFSLLSLVLGAWSSRRVMKPVTELARRIGDLRVGGEPKKLAGRFADDEVGQLAAAFDDYAERLNASIRRDREFNADVSHELRTPLAVVRGAAELLLTKPDLDEKTKTRLKRIERAAQQCTDLTVALLMLSRNERGKGHADVRKLAEQLAEANRAQLVGKPIEVKVEGCEDVYVDAPEAVLSVALGNLIGNACKYTQQGEVRIVVSPQQVQVFDTGVGLSAEDAARLFERGYRGSGAGTTGGGGIGLSIVSRLCELYLWDVSVAPRTEGGAVATLGFGASAS
jgi:signal transduction histidine kinase